MHTELAPTRKALAVAVPVRPRSDAEAASGGQPLSWRLAAPLIGGASLGLWMLCDKAVTLVAGRL